MFKPAKKSARKSKTAPRTPTMTERSEVRAALTIIRERHNKNWPNDPWTAEDTEAYALRAGVNRILTLINFDKRETKAAKKSAPKGKPKSKHAPKSKPARKAKAASAPNGATANA